MMIHRLVRGIEKLITPPTRLLFRFGWLIAGIMSLPIFFDLFLRLFVGRAIPGIIEIEEFLVVCVTFGTMPFIQRHREHLDIHILTSKLPGWVQTCIEAFIYLILTIFYLIMTWQMILNINRKMAEVSPVLEIPVALFVALAAVGTALLTLTFLRDFLKALAGMIDDGRLPWVVVCVGMALLVFFSPMIVKAVGLELNILVLGYLGMVLLLILLFLRMPIGFAMAMVGFLGMWALTRSTAVPFRLIGDLPYTEMASVIWALFPLSLMMGELASSSGLGAEIFKAACKWFGRLPGGLSISAIAGCTGFAGICWESLPTSVTVGTAAFPEMRKRNYHRGLAKGGLAAGGVLGILMPPSLAFFTYATITEESIGQLFLGGLMPGLLLAFLFMLLIYVIARLDPSKAPPGEATGFMDKLLSLKGLVALLVFFILIVGGIIGGFLTPNEAGAIGAVGTFVYALFRRQIRKEVLPKAMKNAATISAKIFALVIGAGILDTFFDATRLPYLVGELVMDWAINPSLILGLIGLAYIALGCVMNVVPIMLLTLPLLFPTILALDVDPIWFCVISVILMEMGRMAQTISVFDDATGIVAKEMPTKAIFKIISPFALCMILCVIILTVFPDIVLYLPDLFLIQ